MSAYIFMIKLTPTVFPFVTVPYLGVPFAPNVAGVLENAESPPAPC